MAVKKKPAGKAATKKAALTEGKQRQAVKPASTREPKAAPQAPKKARKPRADKGTKVAQPVSLRDHVHQAPPDQAVTGAPIDQHPTLWIVGRYYGETWDFQGVFRTEAEAVAACVDGDWFVAPAVLGELLPAATTKWPGCYSPKAEPHVAAIATGLGLPAEQVASDLASAAPVRHFDRAEDEPAGDTLHKVGDRVWVSVACPVPGAGGQHGTVVDILAHDQGFHVALDNGTDPVIDGEYLHPSVPPRQAETEASHREYRWGLVAVCLVVLAFVVVSMSGCAPAPKPQAPESKPDQCLRAQLLKECLSTVPAGPQVAGKYNDWAEVVDECSDAAYYASFRKVDVIPKECMP